MHRWLPTTAFGLVSVAVAAWAVIEIRNILAHPSVDRYPTPSGEGAIVLYHKSRRSRAADVIYEAPDQQLTYVAPIYYTGKNRDGGEETPFDALHWTRDGASFYATSQDGQLLWLFDVGGKFSAAGRLAGQQFESHGGAGALVVRWFEIGATQGTPRLKSWEATRYDECVEESG